MRLNVDWLSRLPAPVRRALYFGLQRLAGSRIGPVWREFQRWEHLPPAQLEREVELKLSGVLAQATARVSYYRELNLTHRAGESAAEFLRRFPVLTRATVRTRFTDLVADSLRGEITSPASVARKRYDWLVVKTGGTTGQPTTVVHDANQRDWGRATRLFAARQCGHPLGTRYFRLWGSEPDLLQTEAKLHLRVQRNLLGDVPMNAFRAQESELRAHHATLLAHPEIDSLMAYVDAAVGLAEFIEQRGLPRPRLRTIMACAGTVTAEWRRTLERVFGAEVFDKYGSRECGDLACECSRHDGLHVFSPHAFLEIVDGRGEPCAPGQTGRVLVTLLNNPGFPLVRYEIGDLAEWAAPNACACGCAWPRLRSLQGRADDMLTTMDGTRLTSVFVRHFVGVSLNRQLIREWQLEQVAAGRFVFRYVPLQGAGLTENVALLQESFRRALGARALIELQAVSEIPPSPTGKVRWIVNRAGRPV